MNGKIHSLQSLGAVDGPGIRFVIFLQGCPLRCKYCHNPDTWDFSSGTVYDTDTLLEKILRFRPYFQTGGGVTVTGGEPLMQPDFVAELFQKLKQNNIHTALDTSGAASIQAAKKVLPFTDLVLADLKFPTEESYQQHCSGSLKTTLDFLKLTESFKIPLWIRHVVAPNLTDSDESLCQIYKTATQFSNLKKIEWLPYKNMCIEKYNTLNIPFPMENTPSVSEETLQTHIQMLNLSFPKI